MSGDKVKVGDEGWGKTAEMGQEATQSVTQTGSEAVTGQATGTEAVTQAEAGRGGLELRHAHAAV
jgi:hypothetical protein